MFACRKAYLYVPGQGLLMQVVDHLDTDEVEVTVHDDYEQEDA